MRLKALRLHGFKSFADRTEVRFHDGITAIVGPNGCGKSNISDAIRWVLGEQRPSAIRGARMEEAIFQGTVSRRPVNRGSVTIEVTNEDGLLPVAYEEVEISRTVYRDGGSEYGLNRASCRLKDIQDLCRDTGLGANAYSIIENRMIDQILSDRAEERRGLFEEAAGIGKYKDRRKGASRRLERAEQDLQRLEDLIGEVHSKVRSLARQKGRAERFHTLRSRRLALEVAAARSVLEELRGREAEIRSALDRDLASGEDLDAEVRTAEARIEALRVERAGAESARTDAARVLQEIQTELVRWERELAVATEKGEAARRRLDRIDVERAELTRLETGAAEAAAELEVQAEEAAERLTRVEERATAVRGRARAVREELSRAREALAEVEERERELARRVAQLMGDADAARALGEELQARVVLLQEELAELDEEVRAVRTQGDLFSDRTRDARLAEEAALRALQSAREESERRGPEADAARERFREAEAARSRLEVERTALERLEGSGEGVAPVVKALLEEGMEGVVGVLADFLEADPDVAPAVEAYLGGFARGVVVRDGAVADRVRSWFSGRWGKGGGLVLLPLDRAPTAPTTGSLLERVELKGEGAPWVAALLDRVELTDAEEDPGASERANGARVFLDGTTVDRRGVVRVGNPLGATGVVERRSRIALLGRRIARAEKAAAAARTGKEEAEQALAASAERLREARTRLHGAEDDHRTARAEAAAQEDRRAGLTHRRTELERRLDAARAGAADAIERASRSREARDRLQSEEETVKALRSDARATLEGVQESWEAARSEESRVTVEETRLQAEADRLTDRREALDRRLEEGATRRELLDREEQELRAEIDRTDALLTAGAAARKDEFARRDEARKLLAEREEAWAGLERRIAEGERAVREARARERDVSHRRHRLELELGELRGRVGRIEERLEGEWGRPLERLLEEVEAVEGTVESLEAELREVVTGLERLGPVNMLAVEEHEEESARLAFLTEQRDDLLEARDDLGRAIREINRTATRLFLETFEKARENFRTTFQRLFEGGECDLWLEDPEDPLESLIEIHASPRGKRTQRIDLLSGGERALTALSLLFGIYLVKPSPFCVLDEVDAPLDESNIGRFIRLLQEFKEASQFVVITHNPRTIEAADWIYGVTMEEPGVSSIVGVRLEEALQAAGAAV